MELFLGDHDKKAELIKRAVEHREADRLIQEYGFFEPMDVTQAEEFNKPWNDGAKTDWQEGDWAGCAVGCLATPVLTQKEYAKLWREDKLDELTFESAKDTLRAEFGIDPALVTMAELLFEGLDKEDAQRWPEQFARALPVGAEVGYNEVHDGLFDVDVEQSLWAAPDTIARYQEDGSFGLARDQLLTWLKSLPVPSPA